MPALRLYGRRWHFSSDIIPLPASIAAVYYGVWSILIITLASATGCWPKRSCASWQGLQYVIFFSIMLGSFIVACGIDIMLVYHGLKGGPFEESKRSWVPFLLYVGTIPLIFQLLDTIYGTWVSTALSANCWDMEKQASVATFARVLVFVNWLFCFLALLGAAIFFNAYPDIKDKRNWERRCGCIATFFCCKRQISRHPDGKTPPLKNIAELTAGLLSHCDLDASDIAAAIILTSAAQQRRRRLKIASALVPLIEELQRNPDPHFARQLQQCRQLMSRDSFPNVNGESCEGLDDDDSVEDENIDGVPCDQALAERLKRTQTDIRSPSIDAQAQSDPDEAQLRVDVLTASRESILQECVQQDTVSTSTSNPQALDQLAEVVREELEQLGASPAGEAVLALEQEKSLDLSMVHFDPDKPSIWFPAKDDSSRDEVTIVQSPDSETQHGSVSIVRETTDEHVSDGPLEPTSSSPLASDTHSKDQSVLLQRQITLQYPVIVTPSQHIQELAGPLSSEALKGIYDGRHSPVPTDELRVLSYFLRYAYAVYSLDPSIEESFSLFSYACTRPEPETVILNSFTELGLLSQQENTEIIHLNCSNRVLSHLPYLIALDHSEKAVVIAIRGTISVADLVTDVVVYPEVIDDWIPESIKVESSTEGPAFAHAGMFSAAKAIYRDMEQRGILKSTGTTVSRNESSLGNVRERSDKKIGELIFSKVKEGWNVMVVGHSLGAGAAALLSLKLCQFFPRMHCIAYSCPGALVSKNVAHAMKDICTTVAVGKDAVPRATVATMTRLMDEFVTSLARCKQPKLHILFNPWWRRGKQNFDQLFYGYKDMPIEASKILMQYYESRGRLGQPVGTYPPGKVIFLRPLKSQNAEKQWDAVYVAPEDLIAEGILVSPMMFHDHLCSSVNQALLQSVVNSERTEHEIGGEGANRPSSLFDDIKLRLKIAYGGLRAFFSRPQAPVSEARLESILLSTA